MNFGSKIVTDGLVFYADAANPRSYVSGSTTTDSLVSDNVGNLINDIGFSTDNQGVWDFDGTDDYIDFDGSFLDGLTEATVETWFRIQGDWVGDKALTYRGTIGGPGTNYFGFTVRDDNQVIFFADDTSTFNQVNGTDNLVHDRWYNACGVYDGAELILYINGIEDGTRSSKTATLNSGVNYNYRLGAAHSILYPFNGNISTNRIYAKALSPLEILQNYNALKGRFGL